MSEELINKVLVEVTKKMGNDAPTPSAAPAPTPAAEALPAVTESIGTNVLGDIIGMVVANVNPKLRAMMRLEKGFRSTETLGAHTGAGPYIFAADEAVKATDSEILIIELPRDTRNGVGYGPLIIFDTGDVSDARRAVEMALDELGRIFGDAYGGGVDHPEFQYTVRTSYTLNKALSALIGRAFGIIVGAPAGVDVILTDTAAKVVTVDVTGYASPAGGTSYSNEIISFLNDNPGVARQAAIAACEMGIPLLGALGAKPESTATPCI